MATRQFHCPWWRGGPPTQNALLPDGTLRVTCNPDRLGTEAVGRWYVLKDPHGCVGTHICIVAPSGSHNLYLVRRLENWAWLLASPTTLKSSMKLATRAELDAVAQEESAASLTKLEVEQMLHAGRMEQMLHEGCMRSHKTSLRMAMRSTAQI
jgi:hypothetical protein